MKTLDGPRLRPDQDELFAGLLEKAGGEFNVFPLSFAQERLWFLEQLRPGTAVYNVPMALALDGPLSVKALEAALGDVVARHESLRTTFVAVGGRPVQKILPAVRLELPRVDLTGVAGGREEALRRMDAVMARPFALDRWPLLRAVLYALSEQRRVLLLVFHHVVTDGWSCGVLAGELAELYRAHLTGRRAELPALEIQYAEFAVWQREWLTGEVLETLLGYWRRQLSGLESVELPADRPRTDRRTFRGGWLPVAIGPELAGGLRRLGAAAGATLFHVLLASFHVLLQRYSNRPDLAVGTPIANRNTSEVEPLVGFFVNTLVVRAHGRGNPSFREFLGRVRAAAVDAYAHQDLPFERLVEELEPERRLDRNPFFQNVLALQNTPLPRFAPEGLSVEIVEVDSGWAKLDLTLTLREGEGGLAGALTYSAELFDRRTVDRFLGHFRSLLAAVAATGDRRLSELPLSSPAEEAELRCLARGPAATTPPRSLHSVFEEHAARHGAAPALYFEGQRLDYAELNAWANRVAHRLRKVGVAPERRVGLLVDRRPEMIVAMLAVLKAGGAYVPLDPGAPPRRLERQLRDAGAAWAVTVGDLEAALPEGVGRVLAEPSATQSEPDTNPSPAAGPDHLAYVIYTSGSTGRPKGVAVEHRQLHAYSQGILGLLRSGELSFATVSTLTADLGNTAILAALMTGGALHLVSEGRLADGDALGEYLERHHVDGLKIVPSHLAALLSCSRPERLLPRRCLVLGGEAASWPLIERVRALAPRCAIFNHYGPTEATVGAVATRLTDEPANRAAPPIGRPLAGAEAHVFGRGLAVTPPGVPGELHLGGAGVSRGYLGQPRRTAERFIPHPAASGAGERLYSTGDLARWRDGGQLEFLGRIDQQLKLRGFRIEPGEIESVLREHPAIDQVTVVLLRDTPGGRLAAFFTPQGSPPAPSELRGFAAERLPPIMVPSAWQAVSIMPLTANGKLDRAALARRAPPAATPGELADAPRTPTEELLTGIWSEVLGRHVGLHDDFFATGGHSLLAARLISRVRQAWQVELPLAELFAAPTVAGLATRLERARGGRPARAYVPVPRNGELPLSSAQEQLWFLQRLDPRDPSYNLPYFVELEGELDHGALAWALENVVGRHEVLRTSFPEVGGVPVQRIAPPFAVELPRVDLGALPCSARELEAAHLARDAARQPFDLGRTPAWRVLILALGRGRHWLLWTLHHVVSDAWSRALLTRELGAFYDGARRGAPPALPELPLQYADFAHGERLRLRGPLLDDEIGYWRRRLEGAPPLELPTDRPRPARRSGRGAAVAFTLGRETTTEVAALGRRHGVTLFMTLLAALQTLLHRHTGQDDVTVGAPAAHRGAGELEGLVGFFVNVLALRGFPAGRLRFAELLSSTRGACLEAYDHQGLPFERLVAELAPKREPGRTPIFQAMLVLQNAPSEQWRPAGLALRPLEVGTGTAKYDLTLAIEETQAGLRGAFEYSTDLFFATTLRRLAGHFRRILESGAAAPERRLVDLALLSRAEQSQALWQWDPSDVGGDAVTSVDAKIDERAAGTPDAVAVVRGDERLTYGELRRRSGLLAARLRQMGVGADDVVATYLERSAAMVVVILGVLEAGAAYLPLEPGQPRHRLARLLADAGPRGVVTTPALAADLPAAAPVLFLDGGSSPGPSRADERRDASVRVRPENLAYVIFTSGSSGAPKGVAIERRQLAAYVRGVGERLRLPEGAAYALLTTFAADLGHTMVFPALCRGGRLHVVPSRIAADAEALAEYNLRHRLDCAKIVPSHLAALAGSSRFGEVLPRLRLVLGGEAASRESVDRVRAVAPECRIFNHYGPTEATVGCLTWALDHKPGPLETDRVPLGRPLPQTRALVADSALRAAPAGVAGELLVGGATVGRGYLGRPAATAQRFVPDPRVGEPGERLYCTGDRCRRLADGAVEFLGRVDHQLKVLGYRIEPAEIEAALERHPAVRRAVVTAHRAEDGEVRLRAHVQTSPGRRDAPRLLAELARHARGELPPYMVPHDFAAIDSLPLTPNGKVDRRALEERPLPRALEPEPGDEPRTATEELLAGIWCELLDRGTVGREQSFFELGGHSLLAVRMLTRVRDLLGIEMALRTVFERPSIAELAAGIDGARRSAGPSVPALEPLADRDGVPLAFAQERLWFFENLHAGRPLYNLASAFRLRGELSVTALGQAVDEIVRRHQVLRLRVEIRDGRPVQVFAPPAPVPLSTADLSALPAGVRPDELRRRMRGEIGRPFDLERGGALRCTVLRLGESDHVLLVAAHHLVSDGESLRIFVGELSALYRSGRERAAGTTLPEPALQYADYAAWQRRWLESGAAESELAEWRESLAGAPPLLGLPTDRPRPAVMGFAGASCAVRLASDAEHALTGMSRRHGATLFMTLLAAFKVLLLRYTGEADVVVGSPVSHRPQQRTEGLIGLFLNLVPLRTRLSGDPSFANLLQRVRETVLTAFTRLGVPLERVVEHLAPRRSPAYTPVFQVMFNFRHAVGEDLELPGVAAQAMSLDSEIARFDLTLSLRRTAQGVAGVVEYKTELFDATTIRHLACHYARLVEAVASDPALRLSAIDVLSRVERWQLVGEWTDTERGVAPATVHGLFETRAAASPGAPALHFEGQRLTYEELDRRAGRLARRLESLGVGPEIVVGIEMDRGPELVVGLLGVLKAGGAYLPLDPAYPRRRRELMLADAGAALLLVRGSAATPDGGASVEGIRVESLTPAARGRAPAGPFPAGPDNLAYVIYTSGSTGRPKGVMISHRQVVSFFAGMDERLGRDEPGTWLAATSVSFDISVLELFWTLTRGATVVLQHSLGGHRGIPQETPARAARPAARRAMELSLFYFASARPQTGAGGRRGGAYRLLLDGARAADRLGFAAVWTPERHFHDFGGLYPNPATTGSAVAAVTEKVGIRAGSVVLPLHHPVRVAEEWAVVDNISGGRVGISFASGWHADDFVLAPANYADRKQLMLREIETVRRLWHGEAVVLAGGGGNEVAVTIRPQPVQAELPVWITASGNPETFRLAGEMGAGILTHLLGQSVADVADKIAVYRQAWREAGRGPGKGHVTLMLHTFVGERLDEVRELVREPFYDYLRSSAGLVSNLMRSLGRQGRAEDYSPEEQEAVLAHGFERYFDQSGLMGTPETCARTIHTLGSIGVDEVACLIDFGVDADLVLQSLEPLADLRRDGVPRAVRETGYSLPEQLVRHQVTHLQCTPSMARILAADSAAAPGLANLETLLIGGETLTPALLSELREKTRARILNVYGPTETTIWSATCRVESGPGPVAIGREILNTRIYVLDRHLRPTPARVPGQLLIAGAGLARGYCGRPALTAASFLPDAFAVVPGGRLYATGDLARRRGDGSLEFLGRVDHQLKLNGYRIEPGEIESVLRRHPAVGQVVVAPDGDAPESRLVAFVVPRGAAAPPDPAALAALARRHLPEHMVPSFFSFLEALPLTVSGKVDRRALPRQETFRHRGDAAQLAPPAGETERRLAAVWKEVLKIDRVGRNENFFEAGGTSLLLVRVHQEIQRSFTGPVSLVDLFRRPTIASLAQLLEGKHTDADNVEQSRERARRQSEAIAASGALDRQKQFMQRRREGRRAPRSLG
ncbi:MAG TPA: amino acid adenylation domain-containing protein [Thermoanaerobaculia bacterium]